MNILLLTSVYPSPIEKGENVTKVVQYFAQEWVKQGHRVLVIHNSHRYPKLVHTLPSIIRQKLTAITNFYIPNWESVQKYEFDDGSVHVCRFPMLKFIPHGDHPKIIIRKQVDRICSVLEDMSFTPDIMMGHWMSPQIQLLSLLKQHYKCRTSLVLHGRGYLNDRRFDCHRYLGNIDALGCRSISEAKYVKETLKLSQLPFVCYSGVPDDYVQKYPYNIQKNSINPSVWKIVYAGRLVKYKNIDKIILALSKIKNKDYILDIIGTGNEEKELRKLVDKLDLHDKVVFHGRLERTKVIEYMHQANVFALISKGEIFGLVYLEAMLASCICIGSLGEGIDGIITDGENGYLVEPGDIEGLKNAFMCIFNLEVNELQRISKAAYGTALGFTDSVVAKKYLENALSYGEK